MKIIIFLVSVAAATVVATIIAKSFGIGSYLMIGGGVGGAVGAFLAMKWKTNNQKNDTLV